MPMLNHYQVCGLRLNSAMPFPELCEISALSGASAADIELATAYAAHSAREGTVVMETELPDGTPWLTCTRADGGYRFSFPGLAEFLVDAAGRRVTYAEQLDTPAETLRHLFLDQVMPLLLNLRGGESLHASAVRVGGGVCAFFGRSGQGKSTLAAAFHLNGNAAYCDDCLLINANHGRVRVGRAYPGLRLWEDSRAALFDARSVGTPVSHYSTKVRIATPEADEAVSGLLELRAAYVLHLDNQGGALKAPVSEPLSMRDGLMALIEYAFRFDLSDRSMILRQLELFERVVRTVPVRRLRLPNDLSALPAARDLVLRELANG